MPQHEITPHWLLRLLGVKGGSIHFTDDGIHVFNGKIRALIETEKSLVKWCKANERLFFSSLKFNDGNTQIAFGWLDQKAVRKAHIWLISIKFEIKKLATKIDHELNDKYIRNSVWKSIKNEAEKAVDSFRKVPEEWVINDEVREAFKLVYDISKMRDDELEKVRSKYVEKCKKCFSDYFSEIESHPLTDEQRTACIIDEDNNRILASAGTGKTSTIVGRVGFLLESGQAKGNEILVVTFARKAAEVIQKRLEEKVTLATDVTVGTFHKLGKKIICEVEKFPPSISLYAEDEDEDGNRNRNRKLSRDVAQWIDKMMESEDYRGKALEYFDDYMYVGKNSFEFKTMGDYFKYLNDNNIRTLKDEKVKGHGERIIANYLFKMGIKYEYERAYEHDTREPHRRQYYPDFFLPEYGVYIEHFGIDKNGYTAPYVNRDEYHKSMQWKREIHQRYDTKLVETYFYEHMDGTLRTRLRQQLEQFDLGIEFNPISDREVLRVLRERDEITGFAKLMTDLLVRYKENNEPREKLDQRIEKSPYRKHMKAALTLLKPIQDEYQEALDERKEIDFSDMINKALDYVESNRFTPPWKYIMIDEFQDISDPQVRLIKTLREKAPIIETFKKRIPNCSLCCIGDDWQAIYRFRGSDVRFTTEFEERFGSTKTTTLTKTFRFNDSISDVSSKFILENPCQQEKQTVSPRKVQEPAISLLKQARPAHQQQNLPFLQLDPELRGEDDEHSPLQKILGKISASSDSASVFVLGRYSYTLEKEGEKERWPQLTDDFRNLSLEYRTIHGSKGEEADYVIVLGLLSGKDGFPSEKNTNPLLEILLPKKENFKFAEERRLFYVALTRARKKVYLVSDMTMASEFVTELIKGDYEIELNEFKTALAQELYHELHCIRCETGILQTRNGKDGVFYGCSNYPLCEHIENTCPDCEEPMKTSNLPGLPHQYKLCIDSECRGWIPLCPQCGGDLEKKTPDQTDQPFWGCSNFRRGDERSCHYKKDNIRSPLGRT